MPAHLCSQQLQGERPDGLRAGEQVSGLCWAARGPSRPEWEARLTCATTPGGPEDVVVSESAGTEGHTPRGSTCMRDVLAFIRQRVVAARACGRGETGSVRNSQSGWAKSSGHQWW